MSALHCVFVTISHLYYFSAVSLLDQYMKRSHNPKNIELWYCTMGIFLFTAFGADRAKGNTPRALFRIHGLWQEATAPLEMVVELIFFKKAFAAPSMRAKVATDTRMNAADVPI